MENTTRLLLRHDEILASRHVLVVEADDPALSGLTAASLEVHSDHVSFAGNGQHAMLPRVDAQRDLVIIILPKSGERLQFLLSALSGQLQRQTEVWLVGPARGGIRGGASRLAEQAEDVELLDSARHCKLFRGYLRPNEAFHLDDWARRWQWQGLEVVSYPGVFSHGRLDEGTHRLLALPTGAVAGQPVLDVGCGCGILSARLAAAGAQVTAVDVSATALRSTEATLAANNLSAQLSASDLYDAVSGRFAAIWTNPPFHEGMRRTLGISGRLIREAPQHLRGGGQLVLVANRGLPYEDALEAGFARVEVVSEDAHFRVFRASLRG